MFRFLEFKLEFTISEVNVGFFGKFISYTRRQQSIHDIFLCLHVPLYNVTVTYMSITILQNISTNSYVHT